ncbi:MAG: glycosyltransferase family 4 protein [Gammaproteobacteria bacterium]|nr:glycosyltransferase family 4 protein [Gammaproteobacteria bacterium]
MNIILVHNRYKQAGGEDTVYESERELLLQHGHHLNELLADNHSLDELNPLQQAATAIWSGKAKKQLAMLLSSQTDLVHIHNTFLALSPSIYYADRIKNIPIVQTLHNYRLLCPNGLLQRQGQVCEQCRTKLIKWPAIQHRCYKESYVATSVVSMMLFAHHLLKTWQQRITTFIAPSCFARNQFISAGLPEHKIVVKPHFVYPDPQTRDSAGQYALFVGRISREKGVHTLISAWRKLKPRIPLHVAGEGLELNTLKNKNKDLNITWLGKLKKNAVYSAIKGAQFLIVPSEWYETFGLVVIEAFACGTPVIVANTGALTELVTNEKTGLLSTPGNVDELAEKIDWMILHPEKAAQMGKEARKEFETKYTAELNYTALHNIYKNAKKKHNC